MESNSFAGSARFRSLFSSRLLSPESYDHRSPLEPRAILRPGPRRLPWAAGAWSMSRLPGLPWPLLLLILLFFVSACSGQGPDEDVDGTVVGVLGGVVFKGLVASANVVVKSAGDGSWNKVVGEGQTDVAGTFEIEIGLGRGNLLVEVTGGTYAEEATGDTVGLGPRKLQAWVPSFEVGDDRSRVQVNPVTTLIVAYTKWQMREHGEDFVLAERRASRLLEEHFGGRDWRSTLPANPTTRQDLAFTDEAVMGVLIAGLSWQTLEMAQASGTTSRAVNTMAFLELLSEDLRANGLLDGVGKNGRRLVLHDQPLDSHTLRHSYALAVLRFLQSERNLSSIGLDDIEPLLDAIANSESPLFPGPPNPWHPEPPTIEIEHPSPGSSVRGIIEIAARARDPQQVTDLGFSEPRELRPADPVGRFQPEATIVATLDSSLFVDGPLLISLFAENDRGLRAEKSFELIVANETPMVHIESPAHGAHLRGVEEVSAYAEPSTTTGAAITEMYASAPSHLVDTSGIANRFYASWDTTEEPDGEYIVDLRAVDEHGSEGFARVTVEVSNREPVIMTGRALVAGRPVISASVRALALDEEKDEQEHGYRVLGRARTDTEGRFQLEIEDRNYRGPVSIMVLGGSWVDPLFELTCDIPQYRAVSTYLPAPDYLHEAGEQTTELSIGTWSTLADSLARHYQTRSIDPLQPADAWALAEEMIAGHFSRNDWPRLQGTETLDLTIDGGITFQQRAWLSFGDFGLVWLMANEPPSPFDLLAALANDISTGRFNGVGPSGEGIGQVGGVTLDVETTRMTLAMAIYEFAGDSANLSGIDQSQLTRRSPDRDGKSFLDDLTLDNRDIYWVSGSFFDTSGPVISWSSPFMDGQTFEADVVSVEAEAHAVYEIDSFGFLPTFEGEEPPVDELSTIHDRVRHRFGPSVPPNADDYHVRVGVIATDGIGNVTTDYRQFTRSPPTALIESIKSLPGGEPIAGPVRGLVRLEATGTFGFATESFVLLSPSPVLGAVGEHLGGSGLRLEMDTSALDDSGEREIPDGPLEIRVRHSTIEGRSAEDSVFLVVDNTPPELAIFSDRPADENGVHWYGCQDPTITECAEAPVSIGFEVHDAISGVLEVRLTGWGLPPGGTAYPIQPATVSLHGGCTESPCTGEIMAALGPGTYGLQVSAVDVAGNSSEGESITVTVDTKAPVIEDVSGMFDDEGAVDFVREGGGFAYVLRDDHVPFEISGALTSRAVWRKMEHRLSALDLASAHASNVPVIEIAVSDPGEPRTSVEDLVVEYLHSWSTDDGQSWVFDGGWRAALPAPADPPASHLLPLSLEWLGDALLEGALHRIRFRAVDRGGNQAEAVYELMMSLLPAPVVVEMDQGYPSAGDPESIYPYSFENGNMGDLFGGRSFHEDRLRLGRFVIHQPHEGRIVPVRAEIAAGDVIEMDRVQRRHVRQGEVFEHPCVDVSDLGGFCLYTYLEPDPEQDSPPCLDEWGDPDRHKTYKVYREDGSEQCFHNDVRQLLEGGSTQRHSDHEQQMVIVLDEAGDAVPVESDGSFALGRGTYEAYLTIGAPGERGLFGATASIDGLLVHGVIEETRRVFDSDLQWVRPEDCFAQNGPSVDECMGHGTRHEDLFLYEHELELQAGASDNLVRLDVASGSSNPAVGSWREPDESAIRKLHVHHMTTELEP